MSEAGARVNSDLKDSDWRQIAEWLEDSDLACLEISGPGWQVRMLRQTGYRVQQMPLLRPSPASNVIASPDRDQALQVVAPHVGVFLDRHPQRALPMVQPGSRIRQGDIVCLLKVGQVLTPVVSPADGVVAHLWASPGEVVGYGKNLFEIREVQAVWK